jgi:hypothetical protein
MDRQAVVVAEGTGIGIGIGWWVEVCVAAAVG